MINVIVSGPDGSGKTTLMVLLARMLADCNYKTKIEHAHTSHGKRVEASFQARSIDGGGREVTLTEGITDQAMVSNDVGDTWLTADTVQQIIERTLRQTSQNIPKYCVPLTAKLLGNMITCQNETYKGKYHFLVVGHETFQGMLTQGDFRNLIDPVTKSSELMKGMLAQILGFTVLCPSYFHPEVQAAIGLPRNFMAVVTVDDVAIDMLFAEGCLVSCV